MQRPGLRNAFQRARPQVLESRNSAPTTKSFTVELTNSSAAAATARADVHRDAAVPE